MLDPQQCFHTILKNVIACLVSATLLLYKHQDCWFTCYNVCFAQICSNFACTCSSFNKLMMESAMKSSAVFSRIGNCTYMLLLALLSLDPFHRIASIPLNYNHLPPKTVCRLHLGLLTHHIHNTQYLVHSPGVKGEAAGVWQGGGVQWRNSPPVDPAAARTSLMWLK